MPERACWLCRCVRGRCGVALFFLVIFLVAVRLRLLLLLLLLLSFLGTTAWTVVAVRAGCRNPI